MNRTSTCLNKVLSFDSHNPVLVIRFLPALTWRLVLILYMRKTPFHFHICSCIKESPWRLIDDWYYKPIRISINVIHVQARLITKLQCLFERLLESMGHIMYSYGGSNKIALVPSLMQHASSITKLQIVSGNSNGHNTPEKVISDVEMMDSEAFMGMVPSCICRR